MGCFKAVLDKVKKDVQKKMGNMPTLKVNDDAFERMSEERSSKKSLSDFMLPDYMEDPRVPMDFTQGTGRIIHDEAEIEQIKKQPKQMCHIERFERYETFPKDALEHGSHLTQKYYHGDLSRPEAEKLLLVDGTNGAWLLRDSHARTNCLTISYLFESRVHHKYVAAASYNDESSKSKIYVATLDQQLAFYDVHNLIEFYRLNKGKTMMCKLGTSIKKESQRDSSPPRNPSNHSPVLNCAVPINLRKTSPRDNFDRSSQSLDSSKSPRSLKSFFSKSLQKALRPKKLSAESSASSREWACSSKEGRLGGIKLEPLESSPHSSCNEIPTTSGVSSNGTSETPPFSAQDESSVVLPHSNDPPPSLI